MDSAVALVQTYLRINGYFTVTEYPVVEAVTHGGYRTATDLDVLAFRFSGAAHPIPASRQTSNVADVDPILDIMPGEADMLVGEVKEGRAELNQAATDHGVLAAALTRFGCCQRDTVDATVNQLIRSGETRLPHGHRVRLFAFGSLRPMAARHFQVLLHGHIFAFLRAYIRRHWARLQASDTKDPGLSFLMMLEKAERGQRDPSTTPASQTLQQGDHP